MDTLHPVFSLTRSDWPPGRNPAPVTQLGALGHNPALCGIWFVQCRNITGGCRYLSGDLDAVLLQIHRWADGRPHSVRLDRQFAKEHGLVSEHEFPAGCDWRAGWPAARREPVSG